MSVLASSLFTSVSTIIARTIVIVANCFGFTLSSLFLSCYCLLHTDDDDDDCCYY